MAKTTRIIRRKQRRHNLAKQGNYRLRRLLVVAVLLTLIGVFLFSVAVTAGAFITYARYTRDLPTFAQLTGRWEQDLASTEANRIYAWRDEEENVPILIYEMTNPLGDERQWISLDQLPDHLIEATVSAEEPLFWDDPGFDVVDIFQGLYQFAIGGRSDANGSTLVEQIVRKNPLNLAPVGSDNSSNEVTLQGRLRELLLIHHLNSSYSRREILEWYLNSSFYGKSAFGVEAASRVYFDKPAAELSLAEAAMLAALPQEPDLNPIDSPEEAKRRQELVLEAMAAGGAIGRETLAAAQFTPVVVASELGERTDIIAPHFALYVLHELETRFPAEILWKGGLNVYTSLNLEMQKQAECVTRAHLNRLSGQVGAELPADERSSCQALGYLPPLPADARGRDYDVNNAAVVVMDAETAEIRAMVGSLNYWDESIGGSFNVASDGGRQPGSALKPFIYLTALSQGYTAATMVSDVETEFETGATGGSFRPENVDGLFHGPMRLRQALGNGYNVPAVQVMSWVGVEKVLRTAHSLGITGLAGAAGDYTLSLAVGGGEVTLLDMVYAYNVMNNMGVMLGQPGRQSGQPGRQSGQRPNGRALDPVAITRIEDGEGDLLYAYERPQRREILTPQLAYVMNDMLSDRSARCDGFGCPNRMELPDNRPTAVATGSTNDFRDAWTIGYTPQLVTGVWVGNSDNQATDGLSGVDGAAPIWQAFMSWAMEEEPVAVWTRPPDLVEVAVCDISGLLATPFCPTLSELFIAGTQPTTFDNIYQELAINRETGRLATVYTPPEMVERRIFKVFPEQLRDWAAENGAEAPPTEYDTIGVTRSGSEDAEISWPRPFSFVSGRVDIRGTAAGDDFDYYRLAFFEGLTPADLQVIVEQASQSKETEILETWDVANLDGLYTLLLTVVQRDGNFTDVSVPLTVDNTPPSVSIVSPRDGQEIAANTRRISIRVQAADNTGVAVVKYYLDEESLPFATSNSLPFSVQWNTGSPGCYTLTAVALDRASNETRSLPVSFCLNASG